MLKAMITIILQLNLDYPDFLIIQTYFSDAWSQFFMNIKQSYFMSTARMSSFKSWDKNVMHTESISFRSANLNKYSIMLTHTRTNTGHFTEL